MEGEMKHSIGLAALIVVGALAGGPTEAGVFYQSIPDLTIAPSLPGVCSTCTPSSPQWVGQAFSLTSAHTVASVTFTADAQSWPASPITLSFFQNLGGSVVGTQVYANGFSSPYASVQLLSAGDYLVTIDLGGAAPTLPAGDYLIFITNPVDLALPAYSGVGSADGVYVNGLLGAGAPYIPLGSGRDIAVALASPAVPEPSTWALIALGFASFGVFARRCSAKGRAA
jgi:hypothetical protein